FAIEVINDCSFKTFGWCGFVHHLKDDELAILVDDSAAMVCATSKYSGCHDLIDGAVVRAKAGEGRTDLRECREAHGDVSEGFASVETRHNVFAESGHGLFSALAHDRSSDFFAHFVESFVTNRGDFEQVKPYVGIAGDGDRRGEFVQLR